MLWLIIIKSSYKILRLIYLQIMLLFVSIPILICWGLPLSIMSVIGNMIFLPFLSVFLTLSFIMFFTELIAIPNNLVNIIFVQFSAIWLKLLNYGSSNWFISVPYVGIVPLFLFILCSLLLFYSIKTKPILFRITASSLMLTIFLFSFKYFKKIPQEAHIQTKNQSLMVRYKNKKLTLIIPRIRLSKNNLPAWYFYEIQPELVKKFGMTQAETIIVLNPRKHLLNLFNNHQPLIEFKQLLIAKSSPKNKITSLTTKPKQKIS